MNVGLQVYNLHELKWLDRQYCCSCLAQDILTGSAVPCSPWSTHCRWFESRSPSVPSLHFPSPKSKGEETSLTWVLSLQMFPENVTFHFSPPELPWLLAQLHHPLKHRVQRNCKALWCPYGPIDLQLYNLAKVIASVKWLFIPQTLFLH